VRLCVSVTVLECVCVCVVAACVHIFDFIDFIRFQHRTIYLYYFRL